MRRVPFILLSSLGMVLISSSLRAETTLLFAETGFGAGDQGGKSVALLRDFDGDGHGDFALGLPFAVGGRGNVLLVSGKSGDLLGSFPGASGDCMGIAVADAGDINGDGLSDLIVGATGVDANGTNSGAAYVWSVSGLVYSLAEGSAFDHFGAAVAGVGDVNRDGFDDFAVSSPQEGNGTIRVYSGRSGGIIHVLVGRFPGDSFGFSLDGAGDVDGDGYDDIVGGDPLLHRKWNLVGHDAGVLWSHRGRPL